MENLLKNVHRSLIKNCDFLYWQPKGINFIIGCPRSGTTAVGKWLCSKSVIGFDEQRICKLASFSLRMVDGNVSLCAHKSFMEQEAKRLIYRFISYRYYVRNKMVIFKEPLDDRDYDFIENMERIFPKAKFIFMVRNPINVVNSMLKKLWGGSGRSDVEPKKMTLNEAVNLWKFNANLWVKHKEKSNLLLLKFENLVENSQAESQRVGEFMQINHLRVFAPKETKKVDLEDQVIQQILESTKEERRFLGY